MKIIINKHKKYSNSPHKKNFIYYKIKILQLNSINKKNLQHHHKSTPLSKKTKNSYIYITQNPSIPYYFKKFLPKINLPL